MGSSNMQIDSIQEPEKKTFLVGLHRHKRTLHACWWKHGLKLPFKLDCNIRMWMKAP